MTDAMDAARSGRNILERLADKIPGLSGYLEREMRREVDKMQRDWLAAQLDRGRAQLQRAIKRWTRKARLDVLDPASSVDKALDRLANRIRHADYGYTGFFDAVKIYEAELDKLYEFDLGLIEVVETLVARIDEFEAETPNDEVESLLEAVEEADELFDRRSTLFEDVTKTDAHGGGQW